MSFSQAFAVSSGSSSRPCVCRNRARASWRGEGRCRVLIAPLGLVVFDVEPVGSHAVGK